MYGAPRSLLILARAMRDKYDVHILTFGQGDLIKACEETGLEVSVIPDALGSSIAGKSRPRRLLRFMLRKLSNLFLFVYSLVKVSALKPDLIYVNTIARKEPVQFARILKRKAIVHVREGVNYLFPDDARRARVTKYIMDNSSYFICVSDSVKKSVHDKLGSSEAYVTRVYNGIDCSDIRKGLGEVGREKKAGGALEIGFLGSLSERKGFDVFLEAAAMILAERRDVLFKVVGGTTAQFDRFVLNKSVEKFAGCGLEHYPFTLNSAIAMANFDIFCMTSRVEPFARVNLEAACLCMPTIATAIDGNREFIDHQETGILVPPNNPVALAAAIQELIDDPLKRTRLSDNARFKVRKDFSVERYVENVENVIDRVLH